MLNNVNLNDPLWIAIIGSMFSGKSSEQREFSRKFQIINKIFKLFKIVTDTRSQNGIYLHTKEVVDAEPIPISGEGLLAYAQDPNIQGIGVDEVQFANHQFIANILKVRFVYHKSVILSFLTTLSDGWIFGPAGDILTLPGIQIFQKYAICMTCKSYFGATTSVLKSEIIQQLKTKGLSEDERKKLIGGTDKYEAKCPNCLAKDKEYIDSLIDKYEKYQKT